VDGIVFNWVEEVANRTMGYVQSIALVILLPILKLKKIKIIWTVHNKTSHNLKNKSISTYFRNVLTQQADFIITHSQESAESLHSSRATYYTHPFKVNQTELPSKSTNKGFVYDILFWGSILPYKGIKEFLEYVHEKECWNLRILIHGKCPDVDYYQSLKKLETDSIHVINEFVSNSELKTLFELSRTVVFTYRPESVLSSGALIESLANYKTVIGPDFGNFKDCQQEGLLYTYTNYEELINLVTSIIEGQLPFIDNEKISRYVKSHSWESYAHHLKVQLSPLLKPALENAA
jgi:hypothetical protein